MESVGHLAAAERDTPELRDAISHLRIEPRGADGRRKAEVGLHRVDGHRPTGQLGIQIQKLFLCTKGAQKIVAAAKGQTAHGGVGKAPARLSAPPLKYHRRLPSRCAAASPALRPLQPRRPVPWHGLRHDSNVLQVLPASTGGCLPGSSLLQLPYRNELDGNSHGLPQRLGFKINRKPKGCMASSCVPALLLQKERMSPLPLQTKNTAPGLVTLQNRIFFTGFGFVLPQDDSTIRRAVRRPVLAHAGRAGCDLIRKCLLHCPVHCAAQFSGPVGRAGLCCQRLPYPRV